MINHKFGDIIELNGRFFKVNKNNGETGIVVEIGKKDQMALTKDKWKDTKRLFEAMQVLVIDYVEFDKFVREYYNTPKYEVCATLECGNDTEHLFRIKNEKMDEYDYKNILSSPQRILTDLCFSGVIPEGNYLVKVSW